MNLQGRRLPDTPQGAFPLSYDDLRPGDYWKVLDPETSEPLKVSSATNLTGLAWFVIAPGPASDSMMFANLTEHTVRELEDGTINVLPGDGSSNSILVTRRPEESWHGYIYAGEWRSC